MPVYLFLVETRGRGWHVQNTRKQSNSQNHRISWVVGTHQEHWVQLLALRRAPQGSQPVLFRVEGSRKAGTETSSALWLLSSRNRGSSCWLWNLSSLEKWVPVHVAEKSTSQTLELVKRCMLELFQKEVHLFSHQNTSFPGTQRSRGLWQLSCEYHWRSHVVESTSLGLEEISSFLPRCAGTDKQLWSHWSGLAWEVTIPQLTCSMATPKHTCKGDSLSLPWLTLLCSQDTQKMCLCCSRWQDESLETKQQQTCLASVTEVFPWSLEPLDHYMSQVNSQFFAFRGF